MENETGVKIKYLRFDNGSEYDSKTSKQFCTNIRVRMTRTIPNKPQQNGVVKRMNITLNERTRSMRMHVGLPKMPWAYTIKTAAYLINSKLSIPPNFKLLEKEWSGKKVNFLYLKVFCCVSYVYIDSKNRDKLDAKAKKMIFHWIWF